jgi:hypothetical protein
MSALAGLSFNTWYNESFVIRNLALHFITSDLQTFSDADKPKSKKNLKDITMFFIHSNLQSSMRALFFVI